MIYKQECINPIIMNIFNIVVIGAYKYESSNIGVASGVADWNNPLQAKHEDLCKLKNEFINITCYDVLYKQSGMYDNIHYINDLFTFDDASILSKENHNILIEFCNLFDENFVNRSNVQVKLSKFDGYKVTVLACGCGWNKGFPLECVLNVIYTDGIVTPCNPFNVDNYLYVISSVRYIYENNMEDCMQPYLYGLYQNMGTIKWRGSEAGGYVSEEVLRELFTLIGTECSKELQDFVDGNKHWNKLSWKLRESLCEFIYGCRYN